MRQVTIMEAITNMLQVNFLSTALSVFIIIKGFNFIVSEIEKFATKIGVEFKWMRKKNENQELLINTVKKLQELEEQRKVDVEQSIIHDKRLEVGVESAITLLEKHIENDNKRTVAILRSTLYRFHSELMEQGYVTSEALKTFDECGKVYEEAGGNDIYHDKLRPEVMSLPIKDS